jgi:UDP-N-acetylmuramoylalanine--D-glutamate ligase
MPQLREYSVVLGLGRTGVSVATHLRAAGHDVLVMDSRDTPPGLAELERLASGVAVHTGGFDATRLRGATQLVVSPGVSLSEPVVQAARASGIPVLGDIELFARAVRAPVIGVTGSNGKSTVTTLVEHMLVASGASALAGANLGEPALELLRAPVPDFYVLELSSFQLERTQSLRARAAVVLNVSADHLDRHASMEEYGAAKGVIYRGCEVAVVNADDAGAARLGAGLGRRIEFTLGTPGLQGFGVRGRGEQAMLARGSTPLMAVSELALTGAHNVANVLAAMALCAAVDVPVEATLPAVRSFRGLPHRMQLVADTRGVRWIDDSKGTNVGATVAAVRGLEGSFVLIAGGLGKGADFQPLAAALQRRARAAVLIGTDAPRIADALAGCCRIEHATSMEDAVRRAGELAEPGDAVLLSPACASQDMFVDYADRGERFARAVRSRLA